MWPEKSRSELVNLHANKIQRYQSVDLSAMCLLLEQSEIIHEEDMRHTQVLFVRHRVHGHLMIQNDAWGHVLVMYLHPHPHSNIYAFASRVA
jgi:hypothetical protein